MPLTKDEKGLFDAIENNDKEKTYYFLSKKTNSNVKREPKSAYENRHTPLHLAAHRGNITIISLLLEYGAKKHIRGEQAKLTPSQLALEAKFPKAAKFIDEWYQGKTNVKGEIEAERNQLLNNNVDPVDTTLITPIPELQSLSSNRYSVFSSVRAINSAIPMQANMFALVVGFLFFVYGEAILDSKYRVIGGLVLAFCISKLIADCTFTAQEDIINPYKNAFKDLGDLLKNTNTAVTQVQQLINVIENATEKLSDLTGEAIVNLTVEGKSVLKGFKGDAHQIAKAIKKALADGKFAPKASAKIELKDNTIQDVHDVFQFGQGNCSII